jgi:hypothetical protein
LTIEDLARLVKVAGRLDVEGTLGVLETGQLASG